MSSAVAQPSPTATRIKMLKLLVAEIDRPRREKVTTADGRKKIRREVDGDREDDDGDGG